MASRDGTLIVRPNVTLTDAEGNSWYFQNGQVYKNGKVDPTTSRVIAIGFVNGQVVQENADKLWWANTGKGYGGWGTPGTPDGHIASPFPYSTTWGKVIIQGSTAPIIDKSGNLWWIDGGKVVENGKVDGTTSGVIAMTIGLHGEIYQENNQHLWWQKTGQGYGGWGTPGTPDGHITFDPIPAPGMSPLWVGGSDNDASKPINWSTGSVPTAGTTAYMTAGTMDVNGNSLADVTVAVVGPDSQDATINLSGEDHLRVGNANPPGWGSTTVNLAANSKWVGGFYASVYGGGTVVQGDGQFANTISYAGNNGAIVNADVIGAGTFDISTYRGAGRLEFMRPVSAEQSVNVHTEIYYGLGHVYSTLQVDDPSTFDASVTLGYGEVTLKGLVADSFSFKDDLLSLFKDGTAIESLRVKLDGNLGYDSSGASGATDFGVSQVNKDVILHADASGPGHAWNSGTPLPQIA